MIKKSDPWQTGIKIFSKFFGIDLHNDSQTTQLNKGANGLLTLNSNPQLPPNSKSALKTFQLKEKWRQLMKFPSKSKYQQVIKLLREGSAIQDQTWVWMLNNNQKISPQLYTQRKQQFNQIAYPKNPSPPLPYRFPQSATEIETFEQEYFGFGHDKLVKQDRKRKFSITKNGLFVKQGSNLTGRTSMNSQCSTFSSRTHNTNDVLQPQAFENLFVDTFLCSSKQKQQSPQIAIKSSLTSSQSTLIQPFSTEENYAQSRCLTEQNRFVESQIHLLPHKISHPVLTSIIGAFLIHREDFSYSITVFNMAATFFYYSNSSQIKYHFIHMTRTFVLLNHVACSQFFVHYLSKNWSETARIISWIADKIKKIPYLSHPLRNFRLQNIIENWLYGFFYSICENGSEIKQIIIAYLLINNFSIDSICNLCQSLVVSVSKILSQGFEDKSYECLQNPKQYIDKKILFDHLLQYQE